MDVAQLLLMLCGCDRGSHMTGRSINNQRIACLWRNVFSQCLSRYYHLIYYMLQLNTVKKSEVAVLKQAVEFKRKYTVGGVCHS